MGFPINLYHESEPSAIKIYNICSKWFLTSEVKWLKKVLMKNLVPKYFFWFIHFFSVFFRVFSQSSIVLKESCSFCSSLLRNNPPCVPPIRGIFEDDTRISFLYSYDILLEKFENLLGCDRIQYIGSTPRKKGIDHREARILRRCSDERDYPLLDPGKEDILL